MNLSERDRAVIWHPYTQALHAVPAIPIVAGEGVYLIDDKGNRYIDAISSWWVNLHGHAHPYIADKVAEQARKLEHVIFAGFTHEPAVELAEKLLGVLPHGQSKVFYSDNGSTAVEVALKMAFQYWHNQGDARNGVIAFHGSYHGDTFGAMSVSERSAFTAPFKQYLFDVHFVDTPTAGLEENTLAQLAKLLEQETIAAIILEPLLQGTAGMVMYDAMVLDKIIALCKRHQVLVIADEVLTGFGRTGNLFVSEYLTESPDIICLSKGLTGGTMALGVTTCTEHIYKAFLSEDKLKTLFHGHSYTANPLACAAGLASLDLLQKQECAQARKDINASHLQFAKKLKQKSNVTNPRVLGTVLAFEYGNNERTYFHAQRDKLYQFFLDKGVLLRPLGNTIYILPPYCITQAELDTVYAVIEDALTMLG